jgi:FAD/FMN-containing dehydrogenase
MRLDRRSLLASAAALATLGAVPSLRASPPLFRRARPGDPGWPDARAWQALNDAVGGNLIRPEPLFAPCARNATGTECQSLTMNSHNPFFIGDQASGTQVSGWYDAWTSAPSAYVVKARHAADVAAAVSFARERNLRIVVKGGGHSYLGTSCAADSLMVWTRAMNRVELHDAFVPQNCEGMAGVPAVSTGSGAVWADLYNAVTTEAGRYVQGGGCTDVGVAGLVQSGGFGSFSKGFGTAAANLLEAEIVTADGKERVCNARTEPELFWALKGGGGGSWGVVTRLTLRTHQLPENLGGAGGVINATSDEAFGRLIARFIAHYRSNLFNSHWGEQASFLPSNSLKLSFSCQGLTREEAKATWQPFFDDVLAAPNDFKVTGPLGAGAKSSRDYWAVPNNHSMTADTRPGAPSYHGWWKGDQGQVGAFLHGYDSLWLPAALLEPGDALAAALFQASRFKEVELHFNKGLAGASATAIAATRDTATNPAVADAFALAIIADGEAPAYPGQRAPDLDVARKDADAIAKSAAALRRVAPDAGSYVSESNFFNKRWQRDYWGPNYARLLAVKAKYDPDGLFFVHHGVGSETWSADGFTRLS